MFKLYDNYHTFVNNFRYFFASFSNKKTFLNFLPNFLFGLINSESTTLADISLAIVPLHNDVLLSSIERRCSRFLNNPNFSIHDIFDSIISDVLSRFKSSHPDINRFFVSFDHMFVEDKHTILMFSLRIGKQGIPIYFKLFPGQFAKHHGDAFKSKNIIAGISYCHNLIKSINPNAEIVFLADRWFGNLFNIMDFINSIGDIFVFRCKKNMKVFYFDKKEGHKIWLPIENLPHYIHHSALYHNLEFTSSKYIYNLAYCQSKNHKESWLLITNGRPKMAKGFYGYRFGSIEFIFKSQKTNGFYLEETKVLKHHAFDNLYSLVCLANLYLTCLGTDISKNRACYKNIGFRDTRINSKTNNHYRVISRFRCGIILFKLALNSSKYYRIPFTFTLHDT